MDNNGKPAVAPVVTGQTTVRKKNWFQKTGELLFAQTDSSTVGQYLVTDIIVPYVRKIIFDLVTSAVDMFLYGGNSPTNKPQPNGRPYVNYNSGYTFTRQQQTSVNTNTRPVITGKDIFDFGNVYFDFQSDARRVLDDMCNILDKYPVVTVAQFYSLAKCKIDNVQADKFGWFNLEGADVASSYDGKFFIKLPKACPIDD